MVPSFAAVSGSILSLVIPLVLGLVLAFLTGLSVARLERRLLERASVPKDQPTRQAIPVPHAA